MSNLTDNLLNWYSKNKRKLPWRSDRKIINPYYVLVSEIMLQQTNVKTVINYYKKFIFNWPTIFSLSDAKVRIDGSLITENFKGSIHSVAANLLNLPSCNGWTFWYKYEKKNSVSIDILREKIRSELSGI